jgi:DNA (cytosine-5)-methyltransferase 1
VLNSKHFGVPQNRERVFIVGHLRGTGSRQIFPIGKATEDTARACEEAQGEGARLRIANTLRSRYYKDGSENLIAESGLYHSRGFETRKDGVSHALKGANGGSSKNFIQIYDGHHKQFTEKMGTLTGRENRQGTNWLVVADRTRSYANLGRNLESPKSVTNALSGVQKDNLVLAVETAFTKANMKKGRFSKECHSLDGGKSKAVILSHSPRTNNPKLGGSEPLLSDEHCFTVDSTPHNLIKNMRIRRLTPVECERLQGFPDGWTEGISDTQRYKLLGNAVTTNVVKFLGRCLRECLE